MPSCVVLNCSNGYKGQNTPKPIRWFFLPKSPALRGRWLFQIHREGENNWATKFAQICSDHFKDPDDFLTEEENKDSQGRKRKKRHLKPTAVPTINMRPAREKNSGKQRSWSGRPRSRSRSPKSRSRSLDKDHDPTVDRGVGNVFEGSNETKGKFFIMNKLAF